jgi:hypothetical protein
LHLHGEDIAVGAEPVGGFSCGLQLFGEGVVKHLHFDAIRQARFAAGDG